MSVAVAVEVATFVDGKPVGVHRWFVPSSRTKGAYWLVRYRPGGGPFALSCTCPRGREIERSNSQTYPNVKACRHMRAVAELTAAEPFDALWLAATKGES